MSDPAPPAAHASDPDRHITYRRSIEAAPSTVLNAVKILIVCRMIEERCTSLSWSPALRGEEQSGKSVESFELALRDLTTEPTSAEIHGMAFRPGTYYPSQSVAFYVRPQNAYVSISGESRDWVAGTYDNMLKRSLRAVLGSDSFPGGHRGAVVWVHPAFPMRAGQSASIPRPGRPQPCGWTLMISGGSRRVIHGAAFRALSMVAQIPKGIWRVISKAI